MKITLEYSKISKDIFKLKPFVQLLKPFAISTTNANLKHTPFGPKCRNLDRDFILVLNIRPNYIFGHLFPKLPFFFLTTP